MLRFDESPAEACRGCGSDIGRSALACPHCGALVHREELERLAREAREAEEGGRLPDAFAALRRMLELLPAGTRQRSAVSARVDELGRRGIVPSPLRTAPAASPDVDASPRPAGRGWKLGKRFGFLGAAGLLLWKLKSLLVIVGSKFKLVLLGLGKLQTLGSMLLSFGVYWSLWGWSFAAGLVIMIYLHEMGHVWALRRYGIAATAPMFIPGLDRKSVV